MTDVLDELLAEAAPFWRLSWKWVPDAKYTHGGYYLDRSRPPGKQKRYGPAPKGRKKATGGQPPAKGPKVGARARAAKDVAEALAKGPHAGVTRDDVMAAAGKMTKESRRSLLRQLEEHAARAGNRGARTHALAGAWAARTAAEQMHYLGLTLKELGWRGAGSVPAKPPDADPEPPTVKKNQGSPDDELVGPLTPWDEASAYGEVGPPEALANQNQAPFFDESSLVPARSPDLKGTSGPRADAAHYLEGPEGGLFYKDPASGGVYWVDPRSGMAYRTKRRGFDFDDVLDSDGSPLDTSDGGGRGSGPSGSGPKSRPAPGPVTKRDPEWLKEESKRGWWDKLLGRHPGLAEKRDRFLKAVKARLEAELAKGKGVSLSDVPDWATTGSGLEPGDKLVLKGGELVRVSPQEGKSARQAGVKAIRGTENIEDFLKKIGGIPSRGYNAWLRPDDKKGREAARARIDAMVRRFLSGGATLTLPGGVVVDKDNYGGVDFYKIGDDNFLESLLELPGDVAHRWGGGKADDSGVLRIRAKGVNARSPFREEPLSEKALAALGDTWRLPEYVEYDHEIGRLARKGQAPPELLDKHPHHRLSFRLGVLRLSHGPRVEDPSTPPAGGGVLDELLAASAPWWFARSPRGGITINGEWYAGGRFIPEGELVAARVDPQQQEAVNRLDRPEAATARREKLKEAARYARRLKRVRRRLEDLHYAEHEEADAVARGLARQEADRLRTAEDVLSQRLQAVKGELNGPGALGAAHDWLRENVTGPLLEGADDFLEKTFPDPPDVPDASPTADEFAAQAASGFPRRRRRKDEHRQRWAEESARYEARPGHRLRENRHYYDEADDVGPLRELKKWLVPPLQNTWDMLTHRRRLSLIDDLLFGAAPHWRLSCREAVREAAAAVELPESQAMREAGNYPMGRLRLHGLDVTIEVPKGKERRKTGKGGKVWSRVMKCHYGYIRRTKGPDGDHLDCYLGPCPESELVFVVDQLKENGRYDEPKVMLGFNSLKDARKAYLAHYPKGWKRFRGPTAMTLDEFKAWCLKPGKVTRLSWEFVGQGPRGGMKCRNAETGEEDWFTEPPAGKRREPGEPEDAVRLQAESGEHWKAGWAVGSTRKLNKAVEYRGQRLSQGWAARALEGSST